MKIYKMFLTMAGLTLLLPLASAGAQSGGLGCRAKAAQLENELHNARARDNQVHASLLERELAKIRGNCSELRASDRTHSNIQNRERQAREWRNEQEQRINDKTRAVQDRRREAREWRDEQEYRMNDKTRTGLQDRRREAREWRDEQEHRLSDKTRANYRNHENKVRAIERDLEDARLKGDRSRIVQQERRLREAREEMERIGYRP